MENLLYGLAIVGVIVVYMAFNALPTILDWFNHDKQD
jgi:hypothetical protein